MLIQEGTGPKAAGWKNLPAKEDWCPSPLAERFPELKSYGYEDNTSFERLLPNGWRIVGATRRGRQHAHQGTHREDAIRFKSGATYTILCVADGAGSSKLSRVGSHLVASRVTEYLGQQFEKLDPALEDAADKLAAAVKTHMVNAVALASVGLREAALVCETTPNDFRCTLLTAVFVHGKKREFVFSNQIGDGAITALFADKTTQMCGVSDSGAFSGEVGCFVPDDRARQKAEVIDALPNVEKLECLVLCTDGVEDPFYPLQKKAPDLFGQLYGGVKEKLPEFVTQQTQPPALGQDGSAWALAQWLGFEKRGENDDRTLLAIHRVPTSISY